MKPGYRSGVASLREQKREAKTLGIEVTTVRRTGEVRFQCIAKCHSPVRANNRRTDGSSAVEVLLRQHRIQSDPQPA